MLDRTGGTATAWQRHAVNDTSADRAGTARCAQLSKLNRNSFIRAANCSHMPFSHPPIWTPRTRPLTATHFRIGIAFISSCRSRHGFLAREHSAWTHQGITVSDSGAFSLTLGDGRLQPARACASRQTNSMRSVCSWTLRHLLSCRLLWCSESDKVDVPVFGQQLLEGSVTLLEPASRVSSVGSVSWLRCAHAWLPSCLPRNARVLGLQV